MKHTWKGPGVFGHITGDILPGKPMPEDVAAETLARLVAKDLVVAGDLPATATVTDELETARKEALGWKDIAQTNGEAHRLAVEAGWQQAEKIKELTETVDTLTKELADADELLKDVNAREQEIVAANTSLTEQLEAANKNIAELTALMTAPTAVAGPKGGKK